MNVPSLRISAAKGDEKLPSKTRDLLQINVEDSWSPGGLKFCCK